MRILDRSYADKYVTVEVEKTIEVGKIYRINASCAFEGIDGGTVIVEDLLGKEDFTSVDSPDHELFDLMEISESYKDSILEGTPVGEYGELLKYLDETIWVAYSRTSGYEKDMTTVLPLDIFVGHISTY